MGDEAPTNQWNLNVAVPRPARIRLIRNGSEIATADDETTLEYRANAGGVYRAEAYLRSHGRERTWILSNPIYLR
jgi:hypothetical protein